MADAAYGDEIAWREKLVGWGLTYAVGVQPATTVWWGEHHPAPEPIREHGAGRPRRRRDAQHRPISVADLAPAMPARSWRTVTWQQGVSAPPNSRFARVPASPANGDRPRADERLIIEWARNADEPAHYWFSNLPEHSRWQPMVDTVMGRWCIWRDCGELKQELGLGHFEGRNRREFHHHTSLCVAAYGFLMQERRSGAKEELRSIQNAFLTRRLPPTRGWRRCSATYPCRSRPVASRWRALSPEHCCSARTAAVGAS
jgi:SRSO17 transposase